ncbi:MAG: acyltransferase, partial [Bacteroidaceae bacterium]|nr:acyltransferase [Bacteroidaceae bacterium]
MSENKKSIVSSASFADSKPHYELLDGLRGAAALMVVWYHVFEGFAFAEGSAIDVFNHGHLAVDFFFMLSGFVISYAYDDRWTAPGEKRLTLGNFFKRRLIRLHPMLMMGMFIGFITFLIGGGVKWDGTETPLPWAFLCLLL